MIIVIVLILLFSLTYLLAGIFVTKDIKWFSKNNKEKEEINNNITNGILAIQTLKQAEEDYYVYYYDTTNEDTEITNIISSLDDTVYRVDLHDDFNSNFIGEPSGIVGNVEDLKVSNPTVIYVSSEKMIKFYSGEEIKNLLK